MTVQSKVLAIAGQDRAMVITGRGWLTYLVSHNKCICLWHQRLAYVNNACVVKAAKLVDGISFKQEDKDYSPVEVLIDSDDTNIVSDNTNEEGLPIQLLAETSKIAIPQTMKNSDAIHKICTPCVGSKSTQIVRWNKSMTLITNKLEEVYEDLWDLYHS